MERPPIIRLNFKETFQPRENFLAKEGITKGRPFLSEKPF